MNGSQMLDGQQQQIDMQGFLGGLIGRTLGSFVGNKIGGSTGKTIGGIAGGGLGALLPFSAGPDMGQTNDLEMQGFFSTLRKLAPKIIEGVQTGANIGHSLGLFSTGPAQTAAANQPSDLEMQSFLSVLKKIAGGVQTGLNVGHNLGLFSTGPAQTAAQPSDLEMQGFLSVLRRISQGMGQAGAQLGSGMLH